MPGYKTVSNYIFKKEMGDTRQPLCRLYAPHTISLIKIVHYKDLVSSYYTKVLLNYFIYLEV